VGHSLIPEVAVDLEEPVLNMRKLSFWGFRNNFIDEEEAPPPLA
jgi:hypothetical protein